MKNRGRRMRIVKSASGVFEEIWQNSKKKYGAARRKCPSCKRFYPSDYQEKCVFCKSELLMSGVSF